MLVGRITKVRRRLGHAPLNQVIRRSLPTSFRSTCGDSAKAAGMWGKTRPVANQGPQLERVEQTSDQATSNLQAPLITQKKIWHGCKRPYQRYSRHEKEGIWISGAQSAFDWSTRRLPHPSTNLLPTPRRRRRLRGSAQPTGVADFKAQTSSYPDT